MQLYFLSDISASFARRKGSKSKKGIALTSIGAGLLTAGSTYGLLNAVKNRREKY